MPPNHIPPSENWISVPLMRGDPSRRRVASVLCLKASNISRARAASSGTSASTSLQLGIAEGIAAARDVRAFVVNVADSPAQSYRGTGVFAALNKP
jgi:hypothetical protein